MLRVFIEPDLIEPRHIQAQHILERAGWAEAFQAQIRPFNQLHLAKSGDWTFLLLFYFLFFRAKSYPSKCNTYWGRVRPGFLPPNLSSVHLLFGPDFKAQVWPAGRASGQPSP